MSEIRAEYKQLFKRINQGQREQTEAVEGFLEDKLSSSVYKLFYGRNMSKDSELESQAKFEVMNRFEYDEEAVHTSAYWNSVVCKRMVNIWTWEKIVKCWDKQFEPVSEFEKRVAANEKEIAFACTCCFLSDFDPMNPIIYCEECDSGVH